MAKASASVLAKVAATLPNDHERHLLHAVSQACRLENRYALAPQIDALREACWAEEALIIDYRDQQGALTERNIWPLAIVYLDRKQVVLAWCCLRQGFRKFFAERIARATACGESFRPKRVVLLRTYLAELDAERGTKAKARGAATTAIAAHPFETFAQLDAWLARHHETQTHLWVRIFKKGSGTPSVD